jgi:hypothetical protein
MGFKISALIAATADRTSCWQDILADAEFYELLCYVLEGAMFMKRTELGELKPYVTSQFWY